LTGLTWQQAISTTGGADGTGRVGYYAAKTYCSGLNLNGTGWRVPTVKEVMTLMDFTSSPTIDGAAFPNVPFDPDYQQSYPIWTATQGVPAGMNAYFVDFGGGVPSLQLSGLSALSFTRCVR
jgi:hypothetical protein